MTQSVQSFVNSLRYKNHFSFIGNLILLSIIAVFCNYGADDRNHGNTW